MSARWAVIGGLLFMLSGTVSVATGCVWGNPVQALLGALTAAVGMVIVGEHLR